MTKQFRCCVSGCGRTQLAWSDVHPHGLDTDQAREIGWRQNFEGLTTASTNPEGGKWYCPFHREEFRQDAERDAGFTFDGKKLAPE